MERIDGTWSFSITKVFPHSLVFYVPSHYSRSRIAMSFWFQLRWAHLTFLSYFQYFPLYPFTAFFRKCLWSGLLEDKKSTTYSHLLCWESYHFNFSNFSYIWQLSWIILFIFYALSRMICNFQEVLLFENWRRDLRLFRFVAPLHPTSSLNLCFLLSHILPNNRKLFYLVLYSFQI